MQNFDLNRFYHTLLHQLVSHRRLFLNRIAVPFIFTLVPCLWILLRYATHLSQYASTDYLTVLAPLFDAALFIYLITCGAFIVDDIGTKKRRTETFLLPASRLEKFVARYAFILLGTTLAFMAGIAMADAAQALLFQLFTGDSQSLLRLMFEPMSPHRAIAFANDISVPAACACAFAMWHIHSVYLLLGTIFRRHAWIKSGLLLVGLSVVLGTLVPLCVMGALNLAYGEGNYNIVMTHASWTAYACDAVLLALIAFNYWAAFRLYSRMQAVANKWYNF